MKHLLYFLFFLHVTPVLEAQQEVLAYPTHWWTGMKHNKIHLLLQAKKIGSSDKVTMSPYQGVATGKITRYENPDYLALDISISPEARPGSLQLRFSAQGKTVAVIDYLLKAKNPQDGKTRIQGVTSKDLTYLLMPDRFANGDTTNDAYPDMRDKEADRNNKYARHGGDLKGIQDHLDYFNELGVTTLWFTPVTENDMPKEHEGNNDMAGYHGYWFTDHYKVDRRLGGNAAYKEFISAAHEKKLKVIQDAIYNHVGMEHWINRNPPSMGWINNWPVFTGPHHREEALMDPYASAFDKNNMVRGWFTPHLPDLNLSDPELAQYIIQHAIWSVEEFGFDGFRIDTYKYCDEAFLNRLNDALLKEFPKLTTFVEAWSNTVVANAYYVQNNFTIPFKHNAPGAIDFSLCFAMHAGMNQPPGWTDGVNRVYMTLAQDLVYKDPLNNCIFLDNHDMDRIYSTVGENWNKLKWGLNWLLTLRGIPQLYYGTEILMKNFKNPTDAEVRYDFPGGWPGDKVNKFSATGRTDAENTAFTYVSKLAHFRQSSSALTSGKTMQYVVRDNVYTYFRYDDRQTVMVMTNAGGQPHVPDWKIYQERVKGFSRARNIISGAVIPLLGFSIPQGESWVLELLP